jgi:hypothetical protein
MPSRSAVLIEKQGDSFNAASVSVPLRGKFDYEGRNQDSQQWADFLSCHYKDKLPAIGESYGSNGNAIV